MNDSRRLLQHFLAAIAHRTQTALRGAPPDFGGYRAATHVTTPHELLWHTTGLFCYARTMLHGGDFEPLPLESVAAEVDRLHATLQLLREDFADITLSACITDEQFLHGLIADAMTDAGQLAIPRRLVGVPVPLENFIAAWIHAGNVGASQPGPALPDAWWRPDQPPLPPGPNPAGT